MNLKQFIAELTEQGVNLWAEGEQLRVRAAKGVITPNLRDLLALHKTELVKLLQKKSDASDTSIPQLPVSLRRNLPLSFAQEGLWFLSQLEPNNPFYNEALALRLHGSLNVVALEKSLNKIIQRHEVLRTNFAMVEGQPVQVIAESLTLSVQVLDLGELPDRDREIAWGLKARAQIQQPFDLSSSGLIQASVLKLTETEHVLLLKIHHIVCDAPSGGLLVRELAAFYTYYCNDLQRELPELPIQYADFAVWQRQRLQGDVLLSQLAYWKQQLEGAPALLELPTDRVRPSTQTFRGARYREALSKELTEALMILSRRQKVTLFMTLLAALKTLLYRYTGQSDICVGTPYANRDCPEIEGLIGLFVNTLVLRTDISGNPSFEELLLRVREVALGAYAHQDLPFEKLVEQLQPARSLSYTPLCQVMLNLYPQISQIDMDGLTVSRVAVETATAKFDLSLAFFNTDKGLIGDWEYNTDLFDASTIARMARHFQRLLEGIVANPQQRVSQLPLLTHRERDQLLVESNNTTKEYPIDKCIHQLFEEQVERSPDAIAVVFEGEQLTYKELNQRVNQLAHHLQRLGVGPEVLVGICVERSLHMIVGLLAILKAGGAYVPLDPTYPTERLAYLLNDSQVKVLLTQEKFFALLGQIDVPVLSLDTSWGTISQESEENPVSDVKPENLAYVIYTSGSTGNPKGVLINHHNVVRLFAATRSWFNFSDRDVWTLFHSYAFDFSVWEIFGALIYGGKLVVVPYWVSREPEALYDLLCQEKVTVLNQTPSAFRQLIKAEQSKETAANLNLRLVIFGGEALELQSLKPWFERHGDQLPQLVNMYGITETTVHVTYRPLTRADINIGGSMIGSPIPDLQVYILDQNLQPVPIGVKGEIHVGGAGLARGYLNRPDLSASKFIPNPFSDKQGARLYKTGDEARYLSDGNLEYLGRIDDQVKIRGFRIELGEIEAVLSQHPEVREVVVIAREDQAGNKRLVAYIVPNRPDLTIKELRRLLQQKLPDYMVPADFVFLNTLPLTPNGKVNRVALPAPDRAKSSLEEDFVAPRTPIEEVLAAIWSQVLDVEEVGIYDNFFAIGGDSLRAIQVVYEANKYNLPIRARDVFENPTLNSLAQHLNNCTHEENNVPLPLHLLELPEEISELLPDDTESAYPLAKMQEFMLHHYANDPQKMGVYHCQQSYDIYDESLDLDAFKRALLILVQKHPALRTVFIKSNGTPAVQVVKKNLRFSFNEQDISHIKSEEQSNYIDAMMKQDRQNLFNVENPNEPLFRFWIFRKAEKRFELLMSTHHAIEDGWGNVEFHNELYEIYSVLKKGEEITVVPAANVYKEFVALEKEILGSQDASNFWKLQLKNHTYKPLKLLTTSVEQVEAVAEKYNFDSEIIADLRELCRKLRVSPKALFLSNYLDLISTVMKSNRVCVGTISNGRTERLSDPFGALGLFWNIVPFCQPSLEDKGVQIKNVQQCLIDIEPYVRYPLPQILSDQQKSELFFATFNFVNFHNAKNIKADTGLKVHGRRFHDKFNFLLNYAVSMSPIEENVSISVEYNKMYFSRQEIRSMIDNYIEILKHIVHTSELY
jgi:amino acid adenylation domain-containing protein